MKLPFEPYNTAWKEKFEELKVEINNLLQTLSPQIDHIGSTSVEGLSAKPIIDIQIGASDKKALNKVPDLLKLPSLVYYEKYNEDMPTRRFFVLFNKTTSQMGVLPVVKIGEEVPTILHNHSLRVAHIHAFVVGSPDWVRHIAFRDYIRTHSDIKVMYQELKQKLIEQQWRDGNEYNEAKDTFLKKYEKIAVTWYQENSTH